MTDAALRARYLDALGIDRWVLRRSPVVTANVAPASASDAWPALVERVAACTRCGLRAGCTQTVFGVGDRAAEWLVVGEAPGAEEDACGEPFTGPAGQLLDAMLAAIDLPRQSVFITTALKCRPPEDRDPRPAELAECLPYLAEQVAMVKPKIILAFGRVAAQNLLATDATLGALRGVVHHYGPSSIPVVVTYHPAYLLRSPGEKRKAWEDLKFARRTHAANDAVPS